MMSMVYEVPPVEEAGDVAQDAVVVPRGVDVHVHV